MRATHRHREERLLQHLRHCARHWRRHGVVPTIRQTEAGLGQTTNMAYRDRDRLTDLGLVQHPPGSESFVITRDGWSVLRREFPDEFGCVDDRGQDTLALDDLLAMRGVRRLAMSPAPIGAGLHRSAVEPTEGDHAEACLLIQEIANLPKGEIFIAEVDGDSMIDAHVMPGDWVFLRRADTATAGQIVAAQFEDGTVTLKRYDRRGSQILLRGASPSMPEPIVVDGDAGDFDDIERLRIVGVYVGLVRGDVGVPAAQTDLRAVLAN